MINSVSLLFILLAVATTAFVPASRQHGVGTTTALNADFMSNLFGGKAQANDPNVPVPVFEIKAKDVKIGALQFLIQIHMVAEGNKPTQGTWFPKQNEDGGLDLYFKDGTGMCTLVVTEYMIRADRYGSKPSLQYMLQESVLLHSVLDELEKTAFEVEDIEEEKRLLRIDADAIDKARAVLPARADDTTPVSE